MHVLLTGAAGFIGSHVSRDLLARGHRVTGLDDLSTGLRANLPTGAERWRFVHGDIRDPDTCGQAMRGVDAVVHLAGRNSVPRSLAEPRATVEVNVLGGMNLLEAARANGVGIFVHASSSSVYGDDPVLPKRESQLRCPLSPYAASKASFEHLAAAWTQGFGLPTVGLRFFNVFGPRQRPDGPYAAVVPLFVEAALSGCAPTIHGDGAQSRDFTYVDNVVDAVRAALHAPKTAAGRVFNVAGGSRTTVLALWQAIAAEVGTDVAPVFGPPRAGDMPHSLGDPSAARDLLSFEAEIPFGEGIRRTVAWYRARVVEEVA